MMCFHSVKLFRYIYSHILKSRAMSKRSERMVSISFIKLFAKFVIAQVYIFMMHPYKLIFIEKCTLSANLISVKQLSASIYF